ncbi:small acid-soluble spore protein SspI [Microaerobacter geothermalis]|uniref:small acid-soluble spore protein SspI n=1 Tax=Microaerobacter geothermalis TaxID=674972 RepID=UPI001F270555|nr:small acid-soluble spore protein SspI [Microaerobacter geothermalis]MCF6092510.1 small acid-soluble spore protein SspI [Microaerobacter geothermalis]
MDIDLRKAVLMNIQGSSEEDLRSMIVDAIQTREEKALPGLGVLFEIMWNNTDNNFQNQVLDTLQDGIGKQERVSGVNEILKSQ